MKCDAVKGKEAANHATANNGISKTQKCLLDEVTNEENAYHFLRRQRSFSARIHPSRSNSEPLTRLSEAVGTERPVLCVQRS
jgi:hypothetical protein